MTPRYYPVIQISQPALEEERLGSKEKFWFRDAEGARWLFKYPRGGSGEHWAEKIAAEIGALIGVRCAEVQLARYEDDLGAQSKSFTDREWLKVHGNEIMAEAVEGYDESLRFGQRDHNVKNIVAAVAGWTKRNHLDADAAMNELVSYAILDGLIDNTDRHHENWMFYYHPAQGAFRLAPSYDHGSSLGRELHDTSQRISRSRRHILDSGGMLNYIKGGKGRVYVNGGRALPLSPLSLAQLLCRWQPTIARPLLQRVNSVTDAGFRGAIDPVPPEFVSDTAKEFAHQLVMVSKSELLRSVA